MKFMMIFEGVDRATKVMNKIMAAEKKVAAASKAGAQATDRANSTAARTAEKLASAYSKVAGGARVAFNAVVAGAQAAGRATVALHRQTVQLAKAGIGQIGSGSGKVFRGLTLATGIAAAAFGTSALAAGQLVGTASQFERFQTILETTEGSGAKAKEAMSWVTTFAAKTPYELQEVMDSFVKLRAYGLDPTNGLLRDLGDTSAAMGKPLEQAVEAIADAVTGENERLKEFGIRAAVKGNEIAYSYTVNGQKKIAKALASDPGGIQKVLQKIMSERFGGAMDKLSATWDGMISNLGDMWLQFQLAIMNAGLFDWMKGKLELVLATVNRMAEDGTLQQWAAYIGDRIITVLSAAWTFATKVYEVFERLSGYLQMAADYVGGWENLAMVLAGLAFAPALISTAAGIVQIAMGLSMLSAALAANPIVLIIAAIVAGAAAIYMNWGPIKAFFLDLWNGISTAAAHAWNSVKAATTAAWEGVGSAVGDAVSAIPALVSGAWERIKAVFAWHPVVIIVQNWGAISSAAGDAVNSAFATVDAIWSRMKALFDWSPIEAIRQAWAGVSDAVGGFIDDAAARASAAWNRVKSVFSFGGDGAAAPVMPDPVSVQAETDAAMTKLAALDAAAQKIVPSVTGAVRTAQTFLASISFYDQGAALMDTMAAGMRARAFVVIQEIQKMAQAVRDHLPSSPAKVGPLSDIHRLKFGETIASSIRAEPMVKAMRAASAATLAAAAIGAPQVAAASTGADAVRAQIANASAQTSGAGGGNSINFNPTVNVPAGAAGSPEDIKAAVLQALRESAREMAEMMAEEQRRQGRKEF